MSEDKKEAIRKYIRLEVCSFGSLRLALKVFRRLTGNETIKARSHMVDYLKNLPDEALIRLSQDLDIGLSKAAFPRGF